MASQEELRARFQAAQQGELKARYDAAMRQQSQAQLEAARNAHPERNGPPKPLPATAAVQEPEPGSDYSPFKKALPGPDTPSFDPALEDEKISRTDAASASLGQGLTFGAYPRLKGVGAVGAEAVQRYTTDAFNDFMGRDVDQGRRNVRMNPKDRTKDLSEIYDRAVNNARSDVSRASKEYPVQSGALEVGGELAAGIPLMGGGKILKGLKGAESAPAAIRQIGAQAAKGGLFGGASSYLGSEHDLDSKEALADASRGVSVGGLLGGLSSVAPILTGAAASGYGLATADNDKDRVKGLLGLGLSGFAGHQSRKMSKREQLARAVEEAQARVLEPAQQRVNNRNERIDAQNKALLEAHAERVDKTARGNVDRQAARDKKATVAYAKNNQNLERFLAQDPDGSKPPKPVKLSPDPEQPNLASAGAPPEPIPHDTLDVEGVLNKAREKGASSSQQAQVIDIVRSLFGGWNPVSKAAGVYKALQGKQPVGNAAADMVRAEKGLAKAQPGIVGTAYERFVNGPPPEEKPVPAPKPPETEPIPFDPPPPEPTAPKNADRTITAEEAALTDPQDLGRWMREGGSRPQALTPERVAAHPDNRGTRKDAPSATVTPKPAGLDESDWRERKAASMPRPEPMNGPVEDPLTAEQAQTMHPDQLDAYFQKIMGKLLGEGGFSDTSPSAYKGPSDTVITPRAPPPGGPVLDGRGGGTAKLPKTVEELAEIYLRNLQKKK